MNKQKIYLEHVKKVSGSPVYGTVLFFNSQTQTFTPGKRHNLEHFDIIDDRTVAINEIIFDFDFSSYKKNAEYAKRVIDVLDRRKIKHYIFSTGGKGVHIHCWFSPIEFTKESNKELFLEGLSYGLSWKNIRLWLWNDVLDEAGINESLRGKGKALDSAPMIFNYHSGTTHLIRECGGRKIIKDPVEDTDKRTYKTYIPPEEFKSRKITVTRLEDVQYPLILETFKIDEYELSMYVKNYIQTAKNNNDIPQNNQKLDVKYTELDGVLKIREGLNTGLRNQGATIISVASRIDGNTKEETKKILEEYVENCEQTGHPFTINEAMQWANWIYQHEKPYWNCSLLDEIGCHEPSTCEYCQSRNKESIKLLKSTKLIDEIKEVLDQEIVGEHDTKMLVFLLILSKDFPSHTGKPGWNIPGDPMSQNIILSSDSSSGKSYLVKKILALFGEHNDDYFIVSRLTKNAINYYTEQNMDGKAIFIEEMQGLDENTSQLRVWMSEGSLSLQTVEDVKTEDGREIKALVQKSTRGQPVFITNQAEGEVGEQLLNRSWILGMDATQEQTANILDYQDSLNLGVKEIDVLKRRKIQEALKQLKPYHFIIPFADRTLLNIPLNDIRARRDYDKFLTLIKCSAYLHQKQRVIVKDKENKEYIIADIDDYEIAKRYSQGILGATFSGLTRGQIELLSYLKNCSFKESFSIGTLMRNLGKSQSYWYNTLKQLTDLGYISVESSQGYSNEYSLIEEKSVNLVNLPTGQELTEKLQKRGYNRYNQILSKFEIVQEPKDPKIKAKYENLVIAVIPPKNNGTEPETPEFEGIGETEGGIISRGPGVTGKKMQNLSNFDKPQKTTPKTNPSTTYILEHIKRKNKNLIPFIEIQKDLEIEEQELENKLQELKKRGDIYEPKPGRYMAL